MLVYQGNRLLSALVHILFTAPNPFVHPRDNIPQKQSPKFQHVAPFCNIFLSFSGLIDISKEKLFVFWHSDIPPRTWVSGKSRKHISHVLKMLQLTSTVDQCHHNETKAKSPSLSGLYRVQCKVTTEQVGRSKRPEDASLDAFASAGLVMNSFQESVRVFLLTKGIKKILFFNPLLLSEAFSAYKVSKSLNYSPHYRMTVEKQLYLEGSGLQLSIIAAFSFKQWKPRVSLHAPTTLCNTCV